MAEATAETTDAHPVLRIWAIRFQGAGAESITVEDVDTDFDRFPDLVERVVEGLLETGEYDDSSDGDAVHYSTDRPDAVQQQWDALKAEHPTLWADGLEEGEDEEDEEEA